MNQMLKRLWKRLICKHVYTYSHYFMMHAGMRKVIVYKCEKCGKEKFYTV